ncbi:phosphate-selective porin O/P [Winogradskyella epiphytica]|uniref:Phosphate-selective porin O/P n=2 Tax=Winogradskyella epiphytica TaxID=262005 RepID=A0A2V4XN85_9FLAO|nr:phosphate-selective porin O/P [Winogradskyella epiphytica]
MTKTNILKMKSTFSLIAIVFLSVFNSINAQDISDTSFGKGMINFVAKDSSFSLKFAPRFQMRSITSWDYVSDQYGSANHNLLIRRARLKFDGFAYSPKLKYKLQLGLSNRDIAGANDYNRNSPRYILDAVIMWNFAKDWELWAGQTKLPGNLDQLVSSGNMQFVERSLLNSRFNLGRDMGIQLHHKTKLGDTFLMREKVAISQGEGRNVTSGNEGGLQYTGRLEFLPMGEFKSKGEYFQSDLKREEQPKLMLAFTYNYNQDAVRTQNSAGSYMIRTDGSLYETDITSIFADAMFKYKGFSFMGEYVKRTAANPMAREANGISPTGDVVLIGDAINFQAGYLFINNYEVALRFTDVNHDDITYLLPTTEYTLGVNKFIVGHKLKVQSDLSYRTLDGNDDNISFRLGFDIHF